MYLCIYKHIYLCIYKNMYLCIYKDMYLCLFVYFHLLSATMNNNKVEGSNRNKTIKKKQKLKKKITPIDDDGAKVHCSLANSVLAPWESWVMSHWCQSQTTSQLDSRWFFNVVLNLSELEICLILVGKLFHKNGNW